MAGEYHNHRPQTNPQQREEDTPNDHKNTK